MEASEALAEIVRTEESGVDVNVLVTGGAGFIGTHLVRRLLREGCTVSVLDNFNSQVHAGKEDLAADLIGHVELHRADVRDQDSMSRALRNRHTVVHLAAETGTGQSMYEVLRYEKTNIEGTSVLADCLVNGGPREIQKVVLASSRAVYGEGKYHCKEHGDVFPSGRTVQDIQAGRFEPLCPTCELACVPKPTSENSPMQPTSFYGLTKKVQEEMLLLFARTLGFRCVALRFQNVYGPGQSLTNPYTGILAVFSTLAQTNRPIEVFEDGLESRDFVYIDDAVEAIWGAISNDSVQTETLNVGTGKRVTVQEVAQEILRFFSGTSQITITGAFRNGDIRHCCADLSKIQELLKFTPRWKFTDGLREFLTWSSMQLASTSKYDFSLREMRERGLLHG
jgi:dTDP-L-rhamnose 4-epimerase